MSITVDGEVLNAEALRAVAESARLDDLGTSIPADVDGGIGTPAILGMLAVFVESAGELVSALAGYGDVLTECVDEYDRSDLEAADEVNRAAWGS